jgi:hypothetical protein
MSGVSDDFKTAPEPDEQSKFQSFDVATYPSDLTLSVIHEMWSNDDIEIPDYQRSFVWTIKQSSLLIESFLLGLPVPPVFFYIDKNHKNLVLDGQQRIMSLVFFLEGYFGAENLQGRKAVFRLVGLSEGSPYEGKTFKDLSATDQRRLTGSVLRAINVRQLDPKDNSNSAYHIFERLNTGGTPLKPQEIRNCVYHGEMVGALREANLYPKWRKIIGKKLLDRHQRDVEMVLRVLALARNGDTYEKPMKDFLSSYMRAAFESKKPIDVSPFYEFKGACDLIFDVLPAKPFHIRGPINLSAMDSIMATLIRHRDEVSGDLSVRYQRLISDEEYQQAISFNTSDAAVVKKRMEVARRRLID